ncbi:hypothetical protein AB0E08_21625 [Streptomyces sp. NPDC048281]|uniref:hypothetical protein n=1 Tax=Streptomyces sp. NPDC048281 TaxID=3154715 RepID=UPI0034455E8D
MPTTRGRTICRPGCCTDWPRSYRPTRFGPWGYCIRTSGTDTVRSRPAHRLDHARRAGLDAISPLGGWRQALIAADCVLGDHSSVTFYATSVGVPVPLGFPRENLDQLSPVAALGRTPPRLRRQDSLRAHIDEVTASHEPGRIQVSAAVGDPPRPAAK